MVVVIDAKDKVLGRLATKAAKLALLGEQVVIVNAEKAVVVGKKENTFKYFEQKVKRGVPHKGPFYPKRPDLVVKRVIRGMLPHKKPRGREALKRIKCYLGVPEEYKNAQFLELPEAELKVTTLRYVSLADVCERVGWKRYV